MECEHKIYYASNGDAIIYYDSDNRISTMGAEIQTAHLEKRGFIHSETRQTGFNSWVLCFTKGHKNEH